MPDSPIDDNSLDEITRDLEDLITQQVFGHSSFEQATDWQAGVVRNHLLRFQSLAGNLKTVSDNIKNDTLTQNQYAALKFLVDDEEFKEAFINAYANAFYEHTDANRAETETEGYQLLSVLNQFSNYIQVKETSSVNISVEDQITAQVEQFGEFKVWLDHIDTNQKLRERLDISAGGKWRQDNPPSSIADWQCRIGASTFYVPPTSISVIQNYKTSSLAGAAIRQPNSPKINLGHSQTTVMMTLYFPTHESIWGFEGDQPDWQFHNWDPQSNLDQEISYYGRESSGAILDDRIIDNYLSSLRGLITQFKYMPFLPIQNAYLNRVHDIDAVTMNNMTVSTVENFPFVAAVTLEMSKFNYDPFMPMLDHFDQAIHWGKFRQMAGRSAASLQSRVNKSFLIEDAGLSYNGIGPEGPEYVEISEVRYEGEYSPTLDKGRDISDGRYFDIYFPTTTPARIFAPDTTDFRQPGEDEFFTRDYWDFIIGDLGFVITEAPDFNFFEYDTKRKFFSNEREILRTWLGYNVDIWGQMTSDKLEDFINEAIITGQKNDSINVSNIDAYRARLKSEWFYVLFDEILTNDPIFQKIKNAKESQETDYVIKEWEVPMSRVDIDWTKCIVTGVGVSLSNKFASLQLQMQDEPTYQHIGGGDSMVDIEMKVLGEENVMAFRRAFQHINGLARLEKSHGVLGFLGIKNIFTALCGIKYVLPISFEVDTIPGVPNVYNVRMSFVDFDVMQQQREKLDSSQQEALIDQFGKANPFLRIKQLWGQTNCYPDFPLAIRDDDGAIIGHMDPDWYFRSFRKDNTDLVEWGLDSRVTALIQEFSTLNERNLLPYHPGGMEAMERMDEIREELKRLSRQKVKLPDGWEVDKDGNFISLDQDESFYNPDKREYRYYLGAYGEDQNKIAIIDMFNGGTFLIGEQDADTEEVEYITGYSMLSEDLASKNLRNVPSLESTSPLAQYQQEYIDGSSNPNIQYENIMKDWNYRALDGRMLKAFPTYMLWLIDEGGRFAGIKLFDNLYSLNSIIDFSVSQSASDPISDTLVLRLSNIYQKLTRPYSNSVFSEDDPLAESETGGAIKTVENRARNLNSGLYDSIVQLDNVRLKPGVRVHLRAGWGNNPNALQTIFNGVITEVEAGEVMTVIAQSDAVELSNFVNSQSKKDHSGKLDGALNNFWLSEPRDLMVRLLSMGSSNFREWLAWGSKGVLFSESRFGIRHFGSILYEPMTESEARGSYNMQANAYVNVKDPIGRPSGSSFQGLLGNAMEELSEVNSITDFMPNQALAGTLGALTNALWVNSFARRDYEVFKRNIYPGNGTGIAQYMGGDLLDAGILVTQAGTIYDEDTAASGDPLINSSGKPDVDEQGNPTSNSNQLPGTVIESNGQMIQDFWKRYFEEEGISEDDFVALLETAEQPTVDINITADKPDGWLDQIFNAGSVGLDWAINPFDNIFGGFLGEYAGAVLGPFSIVRGTLMTGSQIANGLIRFGASPIGQALGLSQTISDSDIAGFDETAFRAQTYMKTVWDLFEVCAALLPNYIVAVRPFEDRSTVFYGKPHWLYTSGLIPITTGVQTRFASSRPKLVEPDEVITNILNSANGGNIEVERMMTVARQSAGLKDIDSFLLSNFDPYNATAVAGQISLVSDDAIQDAFSKLEEVNSNLDVLEAFKTIDYSDFTEAELTDMADAFEELLKTDDKSYQFRIKNELEGILGDLSTDDYEDFRDIYNDFAKVLKDEDSAPQKVFEQLLGLYLDLRKDYISKDPDAGAIHDYGELWLEIDQDSKLSSSEKSSLIDLLKTDPITFAYQFGWRYSRTPVWIGTEANYGYDVVGDLARQRYDEDHSDTVDVIGGNSGRPLSEAYDIWYDFRRVYRYRPEVQEIYRRAFPFDTEGENYDAVMDTFIRFLWQDPFNRAWLTLVASKSADGWTDTVRSVTGPVESVFDALLPGDQGTSNADGYYNTLTEFDGTSKKIPDNGTITWFYTNADGAWEKFLVSNDIAFDGNGVPISGSTKAWMRANATQGNNSSNVVEGTFEAVGDWFDENVGQVLGLVIDSVTGLIASLRLSLSQLSQGLQMAGEMQRQANVLNATLNDSIYYQLGGEGQELARLVDNPFTREYGEPVVEIREPFQRVHMINSRKDILSNQIRENLNGVATVVTAVSDGKNPVTVHFDKGVSPERQVETVVETGIYWDNAFGSGFFGFLQPLINPLESIRGIKKGIEGTSDQLSARKIALYHLKNSLKNIYEGEIIVLGNTEIRPHDLLYIADSYERIYGMVEVENVIHHFTPETGFITSITPNALVSVNDPGRWTMLSYLGNKFTNNLIRDEMRALMSVGVDRFVAQGLDYLDSEDLYTQFSDHIEGAVQWTQGNTGLVRDLGAVFAGGGIQGLTERDRQAAKILQLDIGLGLLKPVGMLAGGAAGLLTGNPVGVAAGAGIGYGISDLAWTAWQWVKDNLLDQNGCYVQFLNKEGQAMDAGLSYFQNSVVGSNHTLSLFPSVFGIPISSPKVQVREDGHFRITTNDLLANLGWTEVETLALYRDVSMFVNDTNATILDIAGRDPDGGAINNDDFDVFLARVLRQGEDVGSGDKQSGVIDGDTLDVEVIDSAGSPYPTGVIRRVRVAAVNTYELAYKDNAYTDFNESVQNDPNDMGYLAQQYLVNKFQVGGLNNVVAIRIRKRNAIDDYDRLIGTIFHNVPPSTAPSDRGKVLLQYASSNPPIPMHAYMSDGRPYTLNWEIVMAGYGNVDMRESLWETDWRSEALGD